MLVSFNLALPAVYAADSAPAMPAIPPSVLSGSAATPPAKEPSKAQETKVVAKNLIQKKDSAAGLVILSPETKDKNTVEASQKVSLSSNNLITLDYENANLKDVLQAIAYSYNLNIIITKELSGTISAHIKDFTLDDALNAILGINKYGYMHKGGILYVMPKEDVDQVTESLPLSFLSLKQAKGLMSPIISKYKATLQDNQDTNTLIITCNPRDLVIIKQYLKSIDLPPMQVLIEAKIIDIDKSDIQNFDTGVGVTFMTSSTSGGGFSQSTSTVSNTAAHPGTSIPYTVSKAADTTGLGFITNQKNIFSDASINALVKNHKARVLASPSIATLNGHEASIVIGQKISVSTSTTTAGGSTSGVVNQTTSNYIDVGTKLTVTPTVSPDGWITMKIEPEVSSVTDTTVANPPISTRSAKTEVRVRNNETIVIGGLKSKNESRNRNGTPFLKDIPILGLLFQSRDTNIANGELTVLITPHIIPMASKEEFKDQLNSTGNGENSLIENILGYIETLEQDKSADKVKNSYLSQEQLKSYRMILEQFPQSNKADYCFYKIAFINAKEFGRCDLAREALMELKSTNSESPYIDITESLVDACAAVSQQGKS